MRNTAKKSNAKATQAKANIKAKAAPAAKPEATEAKKPMRVLHEIKTSYSGVSGALRKNKSRTAISHAAFGGLIGATLTERDNAFMRDIKAAFSDKPFQRGNLDAGNLRRAGERGLIVSVSGNGQSEHDTYKLSKLALESKY